MTSDEDTNKEKATEAEQGKFSIEKLYTKDISFETPHSSQIFKKKWEPTVDLNLANAATVMEEPYYEVVLSLTITVKIADETVYLVEVQQAGIFQVVGYSNDIKSRMLGTVCPNILFPFAREVVSDLVTRGGFPQLLLAPVNFEALYLQQQANQLNSKKH